MPDLSVFFNPSNILSWVILVGIVGFVLMGIDKLKSKLKKSRISEKSLWITAIVGGFLGVIAGAFIFHHKVSKGSFWPPVVVALALWLGLLSLLIF